MADTDLASSVPVRSEADVDARVQVKIVDTTTPTQGASVDTDGNLAVEVHGEAPGSVNIAIALSENGETRVNGIYNAATNTLPAHVGVTAVQRAASPAASDQLKHLSAITNGSTHALDISLHDDLGAPFTLSNPLPVFVADSSAAATRVFAEVDGNAIAAGASSNLDYAVTATKTLHLRKVLCSSSGKFRFEVQTSPDGAVFTRFFVAYAAANENNISIDLDPLTKDVTGTGSKVRVVALNQDKAAQDAHVLFIGDES